MTDWPRLAHIAGESFWPILKAGLVLTIPLTICSFTAGLVLAVFTALIRISPFRAPRKAAEFYVWIFRGTPLLVQLYIVFFGLPAAGIRVGAVPASIIAFSLNVGAYCSETIRSSILAIPGGQWDAAKALGMSRAQALRLVIAPQSFAIALPPLSNSFISLVKDTSLAANITVLELFMTTQRIAARTYEPMLLYCMAALVYLAFSTVLSVLQGKVELFLAQKR